jgi:hypothetical protein
MSLCLRAVQWELRERKRGTDLYLAEEVVAGVTDGSWGQRTYRFSRPCRGGLHGRWDCQTGPTRQRTMVWCHTQSQRLMWGPMVSALACEAPVGYSRGGVRASAERCYGRLTQWSQASARAAARRMLGRPRTIRPKRLFYFFFFFCNF